MEITIAIIVCLVTAVYITAVVFILGRRHKSAGTLYVVDDLEDNKRYMFLELSEERDFTDGEAVAFVVKKRAQ